MCNFVQFFIQFGFLRGEKYLLCALKICNVLLLLFFFFWRGGWVAGKGGMFFWHFLHKVFVGEHISVIG